jgi:uncharacterized protein (TIGR02271 family)
MSPSSDQIQAGDDIYGSDGEKVGTVAEVHPTYLVAEKGVFFQTDSYIPVTAITQAGNGQVVLSVSKAVTLDSGWDTVPDATPVSGRETDTFSTDVIETTDVLGTADLVDTSTRIQEQPQVAAYETTDEDEIVIPLREEELTATVREVEAGAARIQKRVVSEDRALDVPIIEEQIRVQRRIVDRATGETNGEAFEEIIIEVPLTAQQVELRKQARVTEELVVTKEIIQHTEQVRGTVRREEVEVIDEGLTTENLPERGRHA